MKIKRSEILTNDDIWNAVLAAYGNYSFPTENEKMNDFYILFNYFCEMESGGHESLLNWFSQPIQQMGTHEYLRRLAIMLEQIGANDYAEIEKAYLKEMVNIFEVIESRGFEGPNYESLEADFIKIIEKADKEYRNLDEQINAQIYKYALIIYKEVLELDN